MFPVTEMTFRSLKVIANDTVRQRIEFFFFSRVFFLQISCVNRFHFSSFLIIVCFQLRAAAVGLYTTLSS